MPPRHFSVSRADCVGDLRRVAAELGVETLTVALYKKCGKYSEKPFERHFDGWVGALHAAGLKVSDRYHYRSSDEELFENLETVWQRLGRQPTVNDMFAPLSRFSAQRTNADSAASGRRSSNLLQPRRVHLPMVSTPATSSIPQHRTLNCLRFLEPRRARARGRSGGGCGIWFYSVTDSVVERVVGLRQTSQAPCFTSIMWFLGRAGA